MTIKGKMITAGIIVGIGFGAYSCISNKISESKREKMAKLEASNKPIVMTVLSESYQNNLVPNQEVSGLLSYSNETVKWNPTYTLKGKTDEGKSIGLSIIDGGFRIEHETRQQVNVTKEALEAIIEEGSKISFPRGNILGVFNQLVNYKCSRDNQETYFTPNTQMGTKRAFRVTVLE